jgi:hypothetical protein
VPHAKQSYQNEADEKSSESTAQQGGDEWGFSDSNSGKLYKLFPFNGSEPFSGLKSVPNPRKSIDFQCTYHSSRLVPQGVITVVPGYCKAGRGQKGNLSVVPQQVYPTPASRFILLLLLFERYRGFGNKDWHWPIVEVYNALLRTGY